MRLAQYEFGGSVGVGYLDNDMLVPLSVAGMCPDEAILALAMGETSIVPIDEPIHSSEIRLLAPIARPASIRDFMLFEQHLANTLRPFGKQVPANWYAEPSSYFSCPHTVIGPGACLVPPPSTQLDYELEIAVVIGRRLHNPSRDEALEAIAGFTFFNDFSLRDVQARQAGRVRVPGADLEASPHNGNLLGGAANSSRQSLL